MISNWIGWDPLFGVNRGPGGFERLFGRMLGESAPEPYLPLRVTEDAEGLHLESDLPGVEPDSVDVTANAGRLTVRATRPVVEADDETHVTRRERWTGTVERTLTISDDFDLNAVEAHYRHGRLALRVPRRPETKPRRIEVKTAS